MYLFSFECYPYTAQPLFYFHFLSITLCLYIDQEFGKIECQHGKMKLCRCCDFNYRCASTRLLYEFEVRDVMGSGMIMRHGPGAQAEHICRCCSVT